MTAQWRVKTTEAFRESYGEHLEELIVDAEEKVTLEESGGTLYVTVNGQKKFWYGVTGVSNLTFVGLNRSHWDSYEAIGEGETVERKKYSQWAIRTTRTNGDEYVLAWHEEIYFGTDSDGDYVFHTGSQDPVDGDYIGIYDLTEGWDWSGYVMRSELVSLRRVPANHQSNNEIH